MSKFIMAFLLLTNIAWAKFSPPHNPVPVEAVIDFEAAMKAGGAGIAKAVMFDEFLEPQPVLTGLLRFIDKEDRTLDNRFHGYIIDFPFIAKMGDTKDHFSFALNSNGTTMANVECSGSGSTMTCSYDSLFSGSSFSFTVEKVSPGDYF